MDWLAILGIIFVVTLIVIIYLKEDRAIYETVKEQEEKQEERGAENYQYLSKEDQKRSKCRYSSRRDSCPPPTDRRRPPR